MHIIHIYTLSLPHIFSFYKYIERERENERGNREREK